jgi:hypothetical protein
MIQRIQSIWLFLAATFVLLSLKLSFYAGNMLSAGDQIEKTYQEVNGMYNLANNILTIAIGVIALITIFLYSNRKLQMRLIYLGIALELLLMVNYEMIIKKFSEGNYTISSFLQLAVMICFILALRGIRKDNKIIAESDRLR